MSVVSRRFTASPVRTAAQTWDMIVNTIASGSEAAKQELKSITGIIASLISDETPSKDAITIIGTGSRLRVYCLFGDDAIEEEANEALLLWNLFESDWEIYFPVNEADLSWVTKSLSDKNKKFKTYKVGERINADDEVEENQKSSNFKQLSINTDKLK